MNEQQILNLFPVTVRRLLYRASLNWEQVYEIRLRAGGPLILLYREREMFLNGQGRLTERIEESYQVSIEEVEATMGYVANYSLYAYEEELKQGYLTIQGGHRVGVAGKTIVEASRVKGVQYISCINIRLAHEVKDCARQVLPFIWDKDSVYHTLIISPPRCGKTTLLRDLIRLISNGTKDKKGRTVAVIDERSEIAGCYHGVPQNDLGVRTDVLDGCPKTEGMMMAIRSMSPEVIAVDELGVYEDVHAVESVVNCGCKLLATVHGSSIEDIQEKPLFQRLMQERIFQRYILLCDTRLPGHMKAVFNERGVCLYQEGRG
ncbi:MAG: stage III sporulation protein AA [Lachnospiraceae bacterium]|nr:stage III sporulation protein AA [Lachnospiraceae bacterium]MDD3615170.1 stage III sporulation protein AA [Lachnospiraceae bacterium]